MQTPTIAGRLTATPAHSYTRVLVCLCVCFFLHSMSSIACFLLVQCEPEQCDLCAPREFRAIHQLRAYSRSVVAAVWTREKRKFQNMHTFPLSAEGTCHHFLFSLYFTFFLSLVHFHFHRGSASWVLNDGRVSQTNRTYIIYIYWNRTICRKRRKKKLQEKTLFTVYISISVPAKSESNTVHFFHRISGFRRFDFLVGFSDERIYT